MIPQIIYLILTLGTLLFYARKHGTPINAKHNLWVCIYVRSSYILLLYWGGFFTPLFK